jgi:hypothetical protein
MKVIRFHCTGTKNVPEDWKRNNVTNPENMNYYIFPEDRIAVFDNDGTLWAEKPIPFQVFFLLDRLEEVSKS